MFTPHNEHEKTKLHVLYTATTMRGIADKSGIKYGSMRIPCLPCL